MKFDLELQNSLDYLQSDRAHKTVEADPYWPKWNSPWWHMLLLHEMGETHRIPESIVAAFVASLNRIPLKIFPIHAHEMPLGVDPYRGSPCHCQLGNVYQVLAKYGVDVDEELPWIRPWFLKYQMTDGGLNCDNDAYLVKDEVPSSMVGTLPVFEAVLLYTNRPWTSEEKQFLARGASFLLTRKLIMGSETKHNASERESAKLWSQLCFPRFYLYDVLRGLNAITLWAEKTRSNLPTESIQEAVASIQSRFPAGDIRIGRHAFAGTGTILQNNDGEWIRRQPASFFPLLNKVSEIGSISPFLSRQWRDVERRLQTGDIRSPTR